MKRGVTLTKGTPSAKSHFGWLDNPRTSWLLLLAGALTHYLARPAQCVCPICTHCRCARFPRPQYAPTPSFPVFLVCAPWLASLSLSLILRFIPHPFLTNPVVAPSSILANLVQFQQQILRFVLALAVHSFTTHLFGFVWKQRQLPNSFACCCLQVIAVVSTWTVNGKLAIFLLFFRHVFPPYPRHCVLCAMRCSRRFSCVLGWLLGASLTSRLADPRLQLLLIV